MPSDLDSQHPYCVMCVIAHLAGLTEWHDDCTGRDGTRWCACACPWLTQEVPRENDVRLNNPDRPSR